MHMSHAGQPLKYLMHARAGEGAGVAGAGGGADAGAAAGERGEGSAGGRQGPPGAGGGQPAPADERHSEGHGVRAAAGQRPARPAASAAPRAGVPGAPHGAAGEETSPLRPFSPPKDLCDAFAPAIHRHMAKEPGTYSLF